MQSIKEMVIIFSVIMCLMAIGALATYTLRTIVEFFCTMLVYAM